VVGHSRWCGNRVPGVQEIPGGSVIDGLYSVYESLGHMDRARGYRVTSGMEVWPQGDNMKPFIVQVLASVVGSYIVYLYLKSKGVIAA
jgi:hypothetical protein